MGWIEQVKDVNMPEWLKLSATCKYCGSPMMNYYNTDGRCTNRKCSNKGCYGFVAARGDFARKLVGVEGTGFATCLRTAQEFKCTSTFELFKAWRIKPTVALDTFLRIHCFEGIDSEWTTIVQKGNYYTLDELYAGYEGKWKQLLIENKEEIYNNLQYVNLKQRPTSMSTAGPVLTYTIMITGGVNGYPSKEKFIEVVNIATQGLIKVIHQATKRQTGVDYLIAEPGVQTRGKIEAARKGGIPIVSSEEFIQILLDKYTKILEKLNN